MSEKKSFWTTLPGILTGIAGVITAIGGLFAVLYRIDVIGPTKEVTVPNVVGVMFREAQTKLDSKSLKLGNVRYKETAGAAPGIVLEQTPASGQYVDPNTEVNLVVAKEPTTPPHKPENQVEQLSETRGKPKVQEPSPEIMEEEIVTPPDNGKPRTSWPRSPDDRYEATLVGSENDWHYQIREIETGEVVLTTHAEYDTPNDVKAGLFIFSPDSKKVAAAYHYGHAGNYTWIGIWDIETGNILDTVTEHGWRRDIYSVLMEKRPKEYR